MNDTNRIASTVFFSFQHCIQKLFKVNITKVVEVQRIGDGHERFSQTKKMHFVFLYDD